MNGYTSLSKCFGIIMIILLFGCSPKIGQSGFLSNYDNLKESVANGTMLSYISPDFERGKYKKVMIDDIVTKFGDKAKGRKIDQEKLDELTTFFKSEIVKNIETDYDIVNEPRDDVARIQIAITEIVPGKLFSNIFPVSVAINSATGKGKGGASLEMKVVDSQTSTLLGQAIDNRKNRGYIESFSKYGNSRGVMTYWAKMLKERIDLFKTEQ
jgi:hypothetical protein